MYLVTKSLYLINSRGHEITAVVPLDKDSETYNIINSDPGGTILKECTQIATKTPQLYKAFPVLMNFGIMLNDNALSHPKMKEYTKNPNTKFDIVIVQPNFAGEGGYYLAHRFKAPIATFFTEGFRLPQLCRAIGQPYNPSSQAHKHSKYSNSYCYKSRYRFDRK